MREAQPARDSLSVISEMDHHVQPDAAVRLPAAQLVFDPLPTSGQVVRDIPLDQKEVRTVRAGRLQIQDVLSSQDDRLLVVCGPCSLHHAGAALEYALNLAAIADVVADDLLIVMRGMVEKPRTALGWRGLLHDPMLTGPMPNAGLLVARATLRWIVRTGMPVATEFVTPMLSGYLSDLVSYGTVGARTVESPAHRQLASILTMPVGMKNRLDGQVLPAVNAVRAARAAQGVTTLDTDGRPVSVLTGGNPWAHVVLRGGDRGPNYNASHVEAVAALLARENLPDSIVVDAAHGNSSGDERKQMRVLRQITEAVGEGRYPAAGVMIESNLVAGRQDLDPTCPKRLVHGQSITDRCIGWQDTADVILDLARAARDRREHRRAHIRATCATPARTSDTTALRDRRTESAGS